MTREQIKEKHFIYEKLYRAACAELFETEEEINKLLKTRKKWIKEVYFSRLLMNEVKTNMDMEDK